MTGATRETYRSVGRTGPVPRVVPGVKTSLAPARAAVLGTVLATFLGTALALLVPAVPGAVAADEPPVTCDGLVSTLVGIEAGDEVEGSAFADLLDGGAGWDRVDGGAGWDRCLRAERAVRCEVRR
ncbi:hypothetical protein [Nocardioides abyssi]|uniref:Uncharacterized protein n=1 Tax=Nocardioides abyssi TaxID=3058370 RepID=A0ABT8EW39_9ACTN|nr:hypothetical protein [Nocardioides abyssi]MDN4162332.1 hypothetical protein [Nocardioides abyssi]